MSTRERKRREVSSLVMEYNPRRRGLRIRQSKQSDQERITDKSHYRAFIRIYHIMLHSTLHYSSLLLRYYNYYCYLHTIVPLETTLLSSESVLQISEGYNKTFDPLRFATDGWALDWQGVLGLIPFGQRMTFAISDNDIY